jgi:threonine dehydrogenase-like Zn-dependent dehydrogenase
MGHEGVGYIESLGDSVYQHAVGDYVVIPDNFGNGVYPDLKPAAGMTPGYGPDYTEGQDVGGCQGTLFPPHSCSQVRKKILR